MTSGRQKVRRLVDVMFRLDVLADLGTDVTVILRCRLVGLLGQSDASIFVGVDTFTKHDGILQFLGKNGLEIRMKID